MADETKQGGDGGGEQESPNTINIWNVSEGAMVEAFDLEMTNVLANIYDLNTPATASRTITLTLKLTPHEDRVIIESDFSCKSSLASIHSKKSRFFVGKGDDGNLYGLTEDPRQLKIFNTPKAKEQPKPIEFKIATK